MSAIRLVHFADFHLGIDRIGKLDKNTNMNERILDYLDSLDAMIEYAEGNNADIVVFAGDAFHRYNPNLIYLMEFVKRIYRLSKQCPVVVLVGNHDTPGAITRVTSLEIFDAVDTENIIVSNAYEVLEVETNNGILQVACAPYPTRYNLCNEEEVRGKSSEEMTDIIQTKFEEAVSSLWDQVDDTYPAIMVGHFSVDTANFSENQMYDTIGAHANISIDRLLEGFWTYVALGHIHMHQDLTADLRKEDPTVPPVVYSGSMERVDFSEENADKGFMWVEITEPHVPAVSEFVQVDARPYKTIKLDVIGKKYPMRYIQSKLEGIDVERCVVRVIIDADEFSRDKIRNDDIISILEENGMFSLSSIVIKQDNPVTHRIEYDDGEPVDIMSMNNIEKLDLYFSMQDNKSTKELNALLTLADKIITYVEHGGTDE